MSSIYLVTGGAGFIGSALVRALVSRGERVRVLDNFSSGRPQNLAGLSPIEIVEGDIRDQSPLRRAMEGVSVVFHHAAIASVPLSVSDPVLTHDVNVTGTLKVLLAARDAGAGRVVYAASSSAYGDAPSTATAAPPPKVETMLTAPMTPYAVAKLAGELYCGTVRAVYGLETVSLRYFNVFGPRQDPASQYAAVIPRFISTALQGRPVTIYGDGEQTRDFCYIEDVVAANLLAASAPTAAVGKVFNIARGEAVSLNGLLSHLERILGRPIERLHEPARVGDVRHSVADISAARTILGFAPRESFSAGLLKTMDWFRQAQN